MKLSRWLPLAIFLALALLLAAGVWMSRQPNRDVLPSTLIGKPAPDFALPRKASSEEVGASTANRHR